MNLVRRLPVAPARQRGAALFVAVFLLAVVGLLAVAVSLTSVTQQTASARALLERQAWYAALGRIEAEVPGMLAASTCPAGSPAPIGGFTTTLACDRVDGLREGAEEYSVFTVVSTASRGSAADGTLVRRTVRAQFTDR